MKTNVSIQETKIIIWHSTRVNFRLHTDASHDTRYSRMLNVQLPRVIAERTIHHGLVMDGWRFGQNQWNFLLTC